MPQNNAPLYDVLVIGAGPAGLLAAYSAARRGLCVGVLEKSNRMAQKLRITGKGRCNVCNDCEPDEFLAHLCRGSKFLHSSISRFGPQETKAFFETHGVPLVTERGNRVFPASGQASDIAEALIRTARQAGCSFLQGCARDIIAENGAVCALRLTDGSALRTSAVILATGGLSYPVTGSTGDGYRMAKALGHTITPVYPSLVPLRCAGNICSRLEGLSLRNITLTLLRHDRILYRDLGEMVFTAFGISGPLVLSASTRIMGDEKNLSARIDLKPALDEEALDRRLQRDFSATLNRDFQNCLGQLLPKKLIPVIIECSGIDPYKKVNTVTSKERKALAALLKAFPLHITGTRPISEAVITAGGIALQEIHPRTMESKIVAGLHFAGEILDVDGPTGGFNLGVAFASGYSAGSFVLEGKYEIGGD